MDRAVFPESSFGTCRKKVRSALPGSIWKFLRENSA